MKKIFFLIVLLSNAGLARSQTANEAVAIGCGGGFSTSGNYAGNCTIGLPFVGLLSSPSADTARLGMYDSVYIVMGVADSKFESSASLYPNPATGTFTIDAARLGNHISASLYNERGAFVLDATPFMTREANNLQFTLHGLSNGSYILTLDDDKGRYSYKLSIRN